MWRRPSKGRRKLPLQALAPPNNQAMEGNFGCLLLVGWVGRGGWLVVWWGNFSPAALAVQHSTQTCSRETVFRRTSVFLSEYACISYFLELTKLLIIIGDGGDSNQQADSGADEDIEQQAVEKKVGNSPKNKNTH